MAPASPAKQGSDTQWPPRSPHEALISTPGGRQRYRQMMTSPSPSPSKRGRNLPSMNLMAEIENDDEDEDEETLQLKLQAIQARLKLKKLQAAKTKKTDESVEHLHTTTSELVISTQVPSRSRRAATPTRDEPALQQSLVQVPASPVRRTQEPQMQTSPSRVLLGIDKGLKARDISLKRAPSYRDSQTTTDIGHTGYLRRSRTTGSANSSFSSENRPLSFNERLASVRTDEAARAQRQKEIQKLRSNTFGISQDEMELYKKKAVEIPDEPLQTPSFSREDIMGKPNPPGRLQRSYTVPNVQAPNMDSPASTSTALIRKKKTPPGEVSEEQAAGFEPYSSFHLSKRILPHGVLARHVSGKKVYMIKDLLKDVKAPDFALPDIEQDIVIFGILAKKSEPRAHKPTQKNGKTEDRGKYMVMTLVDLEWELDLFLFNSGFTRYWKLTEGTVIGILNPTIMPPPPGRQDTGKFSLVINSDDDSIVEIGTSRDLGGCQSVKKDGNICGVWINKKRTLHCEFHSNEAIRKQRSTRVEINGSSFGARKNKSKEAFGWGAEKKKDESAKTYDWDTKTHWFASRTMSAADLIDGKDRTPNDRKERAEFMKRDLELKERERDMMRKLGQVGNAAGREYMRYSGSRTTNLPAAGTSSQSNSANMADEIHRPDARSLGLLGKDSTIHLSPVKRKRPDSSQAGSQSGSMTNNGPSAFGWGSGLTNKLSKMKDGEKLRKDGQPPVRKKTRFVTDKGIREAGRESLGAELLDRQVMLDDDDDELVIV
ncbi:minichromosome maintenance protein 10 [Fusarium avenaceum]|nr:minichromosome maintenance protein 10 [Fusarium avenaceum]